MMISTWDIKYMSKSMPYASPRIQYSTCFTAHLYNSHQLYLEWWYFWQFHYETSFNPNSSSDIKIPAKAPNPLSISEYCNWDEYYQMFTQSIEIPLLWSIQWQYTPLSCYDIQFYLYVWVVYGTYVVCIYNFLLLNSYTFLAVLVIFLKRWANNAVFVIFNVVDSHVASSLMWRHTPCPKYIFHLSKDLERERSLTGNRMVFEGLLVFHTVYSLFTWQI